MAKSTAARKKPAPAESPMRWSHGRFHWNELMTRDVERAKRFYQDTIGWTFDAMPMENMTYWVAMAGREPAGGMLDISDSQFDGLAEQWVSYLAVDDVDARVEKALAAGATAMRPLFDVPGVGRIAFLREPWGAMIGWITPKP